MTAEDTNRALDFTMGRFLAVVAENQQLRAQIASVLDLCESRAFKYAGLLGTGAGSGWGIDRADILTALSANVIPTESGGSCLTLPPTTQGDTQMTDKPCGFVPFPGDGAYGHWACQRAKFHLGAHRFINYTVPRIPRVWRVRHLWREFDCNRRLRSYGSPTRRTYRRALFPTTYAPQERV